VDMSAAVAKTGVKALHAAQVERKQSGELYISDGDLVVWKTVASDPENNDNLLALLNQSYGGEQREYSSSSGTGSFPPRSAAPRSRPKEIALQIDDDEFWG